MGDIVSTVGNTDDGDITRDIDNQNQESTARLLSCSNCKLDFNRKDKLPLSLQCGHTFCSKCISKKADQVCFSCTTPIDSKPPNNHDVIKIMEEHEEINIKRTIKESPFSGFYSNLSDIYSDQIFIESENGFVKVDYDNGFYVGELKDDNMHGIGKYVWYNGSAYIGEYKNNYRHGGGKFFWADGNIYEGEFRENVKHGIGNYFWASGDVYRGEYKNGNKDGKGKYFWNDGNLYEGEFKNDKKHGKGLLTYSNGNKETQNWSEGKLIK